MIHYLADNTVLLPLLQAAQKAVEHEDSGLSEEEDPISIDLVFNSDFTPTYNIYLDSTIVGDSLGESVLLKNAFVGASMVIEPSSMIGLGANIPQPW